MNILKICQKATGYSGGRLVKANKPNHKLRLYKRYINSSWASFVLLYFKLDIRSFWKGFKSVPLDTVVMDEIILSVIRGNKSVPLLIAKPLYFTLRHCVLLLRI